MHSSTCGGGSKIKPMVVTTKAQLVELGVILICLGCLCPAAPSGMFDVDYEQRRAGYRRMWSGLL